MKTKTLLIDLDGTLIGSHTTFLMTAFYLFFCIELIRLRISPLRSFRIIADFQREFKRTPDLNAPDTIFEKAVKIVSAQTSWEKGQSRNVLINFSRDFFSRVSFLFFQIDGATDFIRWASRKYKLVLATNPLCDENSIALRLTWANLSQNQFAFVSHCENMRSSKPHLQYYQELLKILKLSPMDALMIGNDVKNDGVAEYLGIPVFILGRDGDFDGLKAFVQRYDSRNKEETIQI